MHRVRMAVRENRLVSTVLTEAHYLEQIEQSGRGWVVEVDSEVVGFAIGNAATGNIWALFVHPAHESCGHGLRLHAAMTAWLFAQGCECLWLSTDRDTRAQGFYERAGWQQRQSLPSGEVCYELRAEWRTAS